MRRRTLLMAAASPVVSAACGAGNPGPGQSRPALAPATVRFAFPAGDWTPEELDLFRGDILGRFESANPGIKVEQITISVGGAAYVEKIVTMYAGGDVPDVYWVQHSSFPGLAAKGLLQRAGQLAKRDARRLQMDDFYPALLDSARYRDELYGLPYLGGIQVVLYNRRLLRQAGAPLPAELADQGKWTTDAFLDVARRAVKRTAGGEAEVFGSNSVLSFTDTSPWLWGDGADWFNADRTALAIDTPAAVAVLQYQADLILKHRVAAKPGEKVAGGQSPDLLAQNLALQIGWGQASRKALAKPDLDWDAAAVPRGKVRATGMSGYNPISISTPSTHADAAWELMGHLTSTPVVRAWTEIGRIMPTRKSASQQADLKRLPPGYTKLAREGAQSVRAKPVVALHDEVNRVVQPELTAIANGSKNVRDAALAMKRAADPLLAAR